MTRRQAVRLVSYRLSDLLAAACLAHEARAAEGYTGPYHFKSQNDAIGKIRQRADRYLKRIEAWPKESRYLSNDAVSLLLASVSTIPDGVNPRLG